MTKELKKPSKPCSCLLVNKSGEEKIAGERAVYGYGAAPNLVYVAIVAFYDKEVKGFWVGEEMDVYVLTKQGRIGFRILGNEVCWTKSILPADSSTSDFSRLWAAFDKQITGEKLSQRFQSVSLQKHFDPNFFAAMPDTSQEGILKLNGVKLAEGDIKFDISSQGGHFRAEVTLDEDTLQVKDVKKIK